MMMLFLSSQLFILDKKQNQNGTAWYQEENPVDALFGLPNSLHLSIRLETSGKLHGFELWHKVEHCLHREVVILSSPLGFQIVCQGSLESTNILPKLEC